MAGEVVSERLGKELQFLAEPSWEKRVLGVLLYGSWARGDAGPDSDIDLCLVAPEAEDRAGLWREFVSHLRSEKYDLRIFEILPLHIKMAVIEDGPGIFWSFMSTFIPSGGSGMIRSTGTISPLGR